VTNRWWMIGILAVLIVLSFSSIGLYPFARDPRSERQIRLLIEKAYNAQRPGGGRLSGAAYSPITNSPHLQPDLGKAQILLLGQPDSEEHRQLQGLIYLAAGEWQRFVEIAKRVPQESRDSATLNNLGASFLALSDKDPTLLLDALDAFERASALDPKAREPLFNLVTTYGRLRLSKLAHEILERYNVLDPASPWNRELANPAQPDDASALDDLKQAVEGNNLIEAERLFRANPDLCRRAAMQSALSKVQDSPALLHFIAQQMQHRYGDKTISAMLVPLFTNQREKAIALRKFVNQGAELYLSRNYPESLAAYAEASKIADTIDSIFDRLWIELNKVDTEIRLGQFGAARRSLSYIISTSRKHEFTWLAARALSIYGYSTKLTDSYGEMLGLLSEADRTLADLDATHDRVRVLYYLSAYRNGAGDTTEALKLALECLRLTSDVDASRIATLDFRVGSILYRQGIPKRALVFEQEALEQGQNGQFAGLTAETAATLAQLYESMSQHKPAEQYLGIARDAFNRIPAGFDQTKMEMVLGIVGARIELDQKRYSDAESLLEKNLDLYSRQPFPATELRFPSLMLLARTYSETGRLGKAAQKFNEAIDLVENDDQYLESEKLRVKFDDERRELYDSAIDFELSNGSPDAAWTYLQKYRAKLFLEFLAQFNPAVRQTRASLGRSRVQQQIPSNVQIIEYALLKDRLLIWIVTDKLFTVRSIVVSRTSLEEKVQEALKKLRTGSNVEVPLAELEKLLIEPVADLLDPNRIMAIIPDRALHGLPFAALRRPGSGEYLIQTFPMIVSPSLTYLLATNAVQPRRDGIIGFGSQNGDSSESKELAELAKIYPKSQMFGGREVDKASFLSAMRNAAVFHYAGHSATDAVDPLRSSILLDGNRFGPNSVTAVDIAQQRLANNPVVVLSSCDSSVGNSRDGIGVRGLTSAFLIGGAGSVVGSLWPVEASSTADLMIRFHRAFANSQMPVANALREAQLTFLQSFPERSHPYYWSGFVVTGNLTALR
jgi:CHAT domain-containing protein